MPTSENQSTENQEQLEGSNSQSKNISCLRDEDLHERIQTRIIVEYLSNGTHERLIYHATPRSESRAT